MLAVLLAAAPAWAAFPSRANCVTTVDTDSSDGVALNMPSGITAGALLVSYASADSSITAITWANFGFTSLYYLRDGTASAGSISAGYKFASGSEGSTVSIASGDISGTDDTEWIVCRYSGHHASSPPEAGTVATGSDAAPDSPSLTASWGAEDNLWESHISAGAYGTNYPYAPPANYGSTLEAVPGSFPSSNAVTLLAVRALNAATENPGAWTASGATGWRANTVVIRPAEAPAGCTGARMALTGVGC